MCIRDSYKAQAKQQKEAERKEPEVKKDGKKPQQKNGQTVHRQPKKKTKDVYKRQTGYRAKTRFAKFYNLHELMAMFKEIADIKTADMLNLPVPEAKYHNIAVKPSDRKSTRLNSSHSDRSRMPSSA